MRRRVMMLLAIAALAGSLQAPGAQAGGRRGQGGGGDSSTSVPAPAPGAAQNSPIGTVSDGVSTKTVGMAPASPASAPSNTQNQAAPAFQSGDLVRLRSGGPMMTVKSIKGDQAECFWTDYNGQMNYDSFPVDVLKKG
jgi:uncharacterized protein YodC (DUF2158 family)